MSRKGPINGQKVVFQFRDQEGEWRNLEEGQPNISISSLSPLRGLLIASRKWSGWIEPPTAQDDLVLDYVLFKEQKFLN